MGPAFGPGTVTSAVATSSGLGGGQVVPGPVAPRTTNRQRSGLAEPGGSAVGKGSQGSAASGTLLDPPARTSRGGSNKPDGADPLISSLASGRDKLDEGDRVENKPKSPLTAPSTDEKGLDEGDGAKKNQNLLLKYSAPGINRFDEGGHAGNEQSAPLQTPSVTRTEKDEPNTLNPTPLLAGSAIAPVDLVTRTGDAALSAGGLLLEVGGSTRLAQNAPFTLLSGTLVSYSGIRDEVSMGSHVVDVLYGPVVTVFGAGSQLKPQRLNSIIHPLTASGEGASVTSASDSRNFHLPVGGNASNHSLAYVGASNGSGSSIFTAGTVVRCRISASILLLLALAVMGPAL